MTGKLKTRIEKLEKLTTPKPPTTFIVRWPEDDEPTGPGDIVLRWPEDVTVLTVKYADTPPAD